MAAAKDSGFPVSNRDLTSGASPTWPSFTTPGTNRMIVALCLSNGPTITNIPNGNMTSANLTWTQQVGIKDAGGNWGVDIHTAFASSIVTSETPSSTASGSPTFSRRSLVIFSVNGASSTVGNVASNNALGSVAPTITITATASGSFIIAGFPYRSAGNDCAVDANTTDEYVAVTGGGFAFDERAGSRASSGAGSLTLAWTGGDVPFEDQSIGAIEILASGGGVVDALEWKQRDQSAQLLNNYAPIIIFS